ncbi:hypothetical protein Vadar_028335 [Vaccinium darrowii]|uniref:Uncharacterized protein n=1 Tax=Vaccinium darrowii TaxID=229202 RepID=A0ACB7Y2I4_9ERIC|nr:hypothetical protein Vadar_028335 [Vaccinium darrowii]
MKKFKLFLPIAILFIALPTPMPAYDFLTLSLQWPPTVDPRGLFRRHLPLNFTIHGVWPDRYGVPPLQCCPRIILWQQCCPSQNGGPLRQCCPRNHYVTFTDPILLPRLGMSWPNLRGLDNQGFWQHEWESHGRYSETDYNQRRFFTLGLDLKARYNLYGLLLNHSFIGRNVSLTSLDNLISSYISHVSHKRVQFVCNRQDKLKEIHICFTRALVITDCPRPNSCLSSSPVHIPGYPWP